MIPNWFTFIKNAWIKLQSTVDAHLLHAAAAQIILDTSNTIIALNTLLSFFYLDNPCFSNWLRRYNLRLQIFNTYSNCSPHQACQKRKLLWAFWIMPVNVYNNPLRWGSARIKTTKVINWRQDEKHLASHPDSTLGLICRIVRKKTD